MSRPVAPAAAEAPVRAGTWLTAARGAGQPEPGRCDRRSRLSRVLPVMSVSICRTVNALTAIRRAPTSASTSPTLLGWGAPHKPNSKRSSPAIHVLLAGGTGCASSPSRKAGAEHYLRGRRGVRDLDVIVCFAEDPRLPRLFRRMVVSWDWGPSKLGRCPHDPPEYTGRAVDVAFWVIPDRPSAVAGLREWLAGRAARRVDPERNPDLAHEPVVLIHPDLGSVAWDPGGVPPPRPQRQQGIASPMAWCRREALRLTHHVRLALGSPALVAGKVRDWPFGACFVRHGGSFPAWPRG